MTTDNFIRNFIMSEAVRNAYKNGEEDEQLEPIVLSDEKGEAIGRFKDGDYVIFYDIRGEREIELTRSFVDKDFKEFPVKKMKPNFVTMIEYDKKLDVKVAFPPVDRIKNSLSEIISKNGLKQVKIVESEKAVHLTYFFNGKSKEIFSNEERIIIESDKNVKSLDEKPEMRIHNVTNSIIEKIKDKKTHYILANFANVDVQGHIENEEAIKKAIEIEDICTGKVVKEAIKEGVTTIITADHGTVEKWLYQDGTKDTGHTNSPVFFILIEPDKEIHEMIKLREKGELSDVAPTILDLFNIEKTKEMTGKSLFIENPYFKSNDINDEKFYEIDENNGDKKNVKNISDSSILEKQKRRVLLLILDGWGVNDNEYGNLIHASNTQNIDNLLMNYPNSRLSASGVAVGNPKGSVGNSEVGHLHLGAGRRILSDKVRIDNSIIDETFFENNSFQWAMRNAKLEKKALHLLGIVSFFSSHGSIEHLKALIKLAKKEDVDNVYIHALLGRRGEKPESGAIYINEIEKECLKLNTGKLVSVIGRHWALDREENWDRVEKTYRTLVYGDGRKVILK